LVSIFRTKVGLRVLIIMEIIGLIISLISIPFSVYGALPTTIIQNCYDGDTCTTIDGEKI